MNQLEVYQFIGRTLSPYSNMDSNIVCAQQIMHRELDWERIISIATGHLVAPALYASLLRKDFLKLLSEELQHYFHTMYSYNTQRNVGLNGQIEELLHYLPPGAILLKGGASLTSELYSQVGERVMRDLDILVKIESMHSTVKQLFSIGYRYCELDSLPEPPLDEQEDPIEALNARGLGYMHHIYPLVHPKHNASVELHRQPLLQLGERELLSSGEAFSNAVQCKNLKMLSIEHRLLHNFFHAQIQDRNGLLGKIDLMQAYEFVQLVYRHQGAVQWDQLQRRVKECGLEIHFQVYLLYVEDYFYCPIPENISISRRSRRIIKRQQLLEKYKVLRIIHGPTMLFVFSICRELSPIRVKEKYGPISFVIAYLMAITTLPFRLLKPGTIKATFRQLRDSFRG